MNRNDFINMIEHSGPSDRQTIGELNEIISIFPYFQSAYMLLLKGLQMTSDVKFASQLGSYAMHIADREALYYFLKNEPDIDKSAESAPEVLDISSDVPDSGQTVIESAKNSADLINEIEKHSAEDTGNKKEDDHSLIISTDEGYDGSDAAVMIIDEESGTVEEKIVFMDPGFSIGEPEDLLELESEEHAGAEDMLIRNQEDTSGEDIKQSQAELIDKFIEANPRIEPVRERTDNPVEDISKPFTMEKGSFVTETLAGIYVNQGYYSKAIDIYEKLSLKFPEKSSYFASQIEKVKELLK